MLRVSVALTCSALLVTFVYQIGCRLGYQKNITTWNEEQERKESGILDRTK